ncbi:MAG: ABC transporter permease [Clostridia bacterium]
MTWLKKKFEATPKLASILTIYALLLIVFLVMCAYSETYRSVYNITNMIAQCMPLACVAMGQTVVIISGGLDLSVGSAISVCTVVAAKLMNTDNPIELAAGVLAVLATGLAVGAVNGYGVHYLRVPPMITTLCTSTMLSGIALGILPMAGGKINKLFAKFVYQKWDVISMPLIIMLVLFLILRWFLYKTRSGVSIYAIGQNKQIARTMGVKVRKTGMKVFLVCGLCAAITGLLLACRMRVGDPTCGTSYSMDSITAAVIGGTAMTGGMGLLSGTIAGALLVGMLSNIMNILAVNQFYQYVFKGGLLVAAMVIYSISNLLEGKRHER